ncbi:MAG TPA: SH3 domain-containing protein [Nocardioidaceae bacterium]|nr:SH3 domain-containing protein [Nocardioidaceae bacterium]
MAAVATLASSAAAFAWTDDAEPQSAVAISRDVEPQVTPEPVSVRVEPISRSEERVRLEPKPPEVVDHAYATTKLNIWTGPGENSTFLGVVDWAEKVAVSGETQGAWAEIVVDEKSRWVRAEYLAEQKPKPEPEPEPEVEAAAEPAAPETGLSTAPCATGSDVESGLTSNAVAVHRAVCAAFPEVSSYGGVRPGDDGEHGTGQALDIMTTDGDAIAAFVQENADELGVSYIIWAQEIWSVEQASEGWRYMEDRGSTTANHYDHVHVTVY